jgi:hypothetical protein
VRIPQCEEETPQAVIALHMSVFLPGGSFGVGAF